MTVLRAFRRSLDLLSVRDRRKLAAVTVVQAATSILDLVGVLLLGLVGALAVTSVQGSPPPPAVADFANRMGLEDLTGTDLLLVLAAVASGVLLFKSAISSYLLRRAFQFLAGRQAVVSAELIDGLFSRPLTFVQQRSSQHTAYALVQGAASATLVMLGQGVIFVSELSLLVILGMVLTWINPAVALGCIAFFALIAIALQLVLGRWAMRVGHHVAESDISSLDAIQEAFSAFREITVLDRKATYLKRIQSLRWLAANSAADLQFIAAVPKYVLEVALVAGGLLLAGALLTTQNTVTAVGTLALFVAAATRVMPSLLRLQGATLSMRNAAGLASSTLDLADALRDTTISAVYTQTSFQAQESPNPTTKFDPRVELKGVTFTYPASTTPAVYSVSLIAEPGSSVALVGPSGAGKSTLADLVLGILEPQQGVVRVGGLAPVEAIGRWAGSIAYVPQDVALANGSIRANVALGIPEEDIDDTSIWEALERSHLIQVVAQSKAGLDAQVGERGLRLSGGQRQRLGIARALYSSPSLLVLDEATSALDAETERSITATVTALEGTVTTIVIAHRLSTVRNVDQVIYMKEGGIEARGSFADVRAAVPAFARQAGIMGLD